MRRTIFLGATALVVASAVTCACEKRSPLCTDIDGALPGTVTFRKCTDGLPRELSCPAVAGQPDAELMCACTTAGKLGASFTLFSDAVNARQDAVKAIQIGNRRCGWSLSERRAR